MRKISVLLSEREESRFCAYCRETGHKKSTLIAHLIKEHLDKESGKLGPSLVRRPTASHLNRKVTGQEGSRLSQQRGRETRRGKQ